MREERSELNPAGRAARKGANQLLAAAFGSVDAFVDALRDPAHAQHAVALEASYGANTQSYLLPVVDFYLRGYAPAPARHHTATTPP